MSRRRFIALSLLLDAILVYAGFVAVFAVRFFNEGFFPAYNFNPFLILSPAIVLFYLFSGYVNGLYVPERTETPWAVARSVILTVGLGTLFTFALAFLGGDATKGFNRPVIFFSALAIAVLLVTWRMVFLRVGTIRWPIQRVLIVGTGETSIELASELTKRSKWGFRVIGLIDPRRDPDCLAEQVTDEFPVLGCATEIARLAAEHDIGRVIVVSPIALRELVESLVLADEVRVRVDVVPELYEVFIGTVDSIVGDIPLMEITRSGATTAYAGVKRALDVVFSAVLLLLLSPILLAAWAAVLISMGRPAVFAQERSGKDLKPFKVLKFRTMVKDAEKLSGPVLAEEDDPRITPLGRFMRTYRVDELPQILNILRGDMSFVGPRPERPFFVERFVQEIPGYRERFAVKPGVTGLAQVSGGYATTPERKLKYDLIYMYHQSLLMDVQIIVETLRVVLTGHGAR